MDADAASIVLHNVAHRIYQGVCYSKCRTLLWYTLKCSFIYSHRIRTASLWQFFRKSHKIKNIMY